HHLVAASNQIALIPNAPANAVQLQLAQILQELGHMNGRLGHVEVLLAQVDLGFRAFRTRIQNLLPMRLRNATASLNALLTYPANVQVPAQAQTKASLIQLAAVNCQIVAHILHLPPLPADTLVVDRRQQIADYLGCGILVPAHA
ncbi:hypothetical protein BS47DRAFT_1342282, partial [Hydnum rufescens UP504]